MGCDAPGTPGLTPPTAVFDETGLDRLVTVLRERGCEVIGPVRGESAIELGPLHSADDLPRGWGVHTEPGVYRLENRGDGARFGHSAGPQSWKQYLHPPRRRLWSSGPDLTGDPEPAQPEAVPRYAFLGVRGCDLAAIATLDRVLGGGGHEDSHYTGRRRRVFVVAVNCTEPGELCFCASMHTGPAAGPGYDLALTELVDGQRCRYVAAAGSDEGAEVLAQIPHEAAAPADRDAAADGVRRAADQMGRRMPDTDLRALLLESRESPHWDDVASRCLTCGNCTMVCPTCFCTSTEDVTDLTGGHAERWQHWASCFELDFSLVHQGSVRQSGAARYRQWITHKLGTWHDQFDMSGCVGCGRCIAWCPTGIDITAEMSTLAGLAERTRDGDDD
ncbi:4Fe-4S dicluster domain-containing protein [Mycolicibacterium palauense]|uniref:4Fe-4S dicluster domain-containing protein n=1 Tax=Mycolicibacterium palauense TaxID=2034511 RepID=UPI000BFEAB20|nr:4Fe-4S dicluster domain-containing protein [Mycolicibacterium palauense]